MQQREQELLLRKIGKRRDEIKRCFTSNVMPITDIVYRETKAYERYEEAVAAKGYRPIKHGEQWGGGCNGWFKIRFTIPEQWKGKQAAAYFNFGGEACAFINGAPYQGIDHNHEEMLLTTNAKGGESYELIVDVASSEPWNPKSTRKVVFSRAELGTRNPEVRQYWYDLYMLSVLAEALPIDDARRMKIVYTLNKSVDAFDYTNTDEESLRKSSIRAQQILQPLLAQKSTASAGKIAAIGHSHLDVGYRWPYRETVRKTARTFSTVMRLMEQYPEYLFAQSQCQLYQYAKESYPALYEEIKRRVSEGRWEVTGSMWVEADCNLPSGESLVRQVVMGKNYFIDAFGIETNVLWLPDVFGYSAALPQILKLARVPYFSTVKLNWNQFNKFPYSTFHWRGIDGSRVLSHIPPDGDYNHYPKASVLRQLISDNPEKDRCDWTLMSYGWGDGGGGAEESHLESLRRVEDLEGLPKCRQMKIRDFFAEIASCESLPEWAGELYLEFHRGTYTTQAGNKRYNRQAEFLFRDAELLSSVAAPLGLPYPREELQEQWKQILLHQFHDVIPGSCIREVVEDTDRMYPEIFRAGEAIVDTATAEIAKSIDARGEGDAIVVFNTLPWDRTDVARIKTPSQDEYAVLAPEGVEVPSQVVADELQFTAEVPSMGYATYRLVKRERHGCESELKVSRRALENRFYRIRLDRNGTISSLVHKPTGREVIPKGTRGNLLQLFEDKPFVYDAWELDFFHTDKFQDMTQLNDIRVLHEGPLSAAIEMMRSFGKSRSKQKMVIYADSPRIDFETWVDWREEHKCLKVSFPVDVNATMARYEIQFGNVERPTHRNTSWDFARFEVCAHKWADLSEPDFGVSLLNDCKYGHQTEGNVMRLTLLRAPQEPDPIADIGEHHLTYSILPHAGSYAEAGTVRQAYQLNVPLRATIVQPSKGVLPASRSFVSVDSNNVILDTVKKAERGEGMILRFYECHGIRGNVRVVLEMPFESVCECDLMEDLIGEADTNGSELSFDIKPFELKTFKLV